MKVIDVMKQEGARFLKQTQNNGWYIMTDKQAKQTVSQYFISMKRSKNCNDSTLTWPNVENTPVSGSNNKEITTPLPDTIIIEQLSIVHKVLSSWNSGVFSSKHYYH